MADFMTVLAATQKPAGNGAQNNILASLLAGTQFDSVLSTQIAASTAAASEAQALALLPPTALPQAAEEVISVLGKPATTGRKAPPTTADSDLAASLSGMMPMSLPREPVADKPAAPTEAVADKPTAHAEAGAGRLPAELPATLKMAATPAAASAMKGQELPLAAATSNVAALLVQPATEVATQTPQDNVQTDATALRQLGQFDQVARPAEPRTQAAVAAPVHSQAFAGELSEKVVWLAGKGSQQAEISLNPSQLGPVEVRLTLTGSEAGAQFFSPHPAVRDAIEAALPKLRELMAQAGIALGDSQVHDQAFARGEANGGDSGSRGSETAAGNTPAMVTSLASQSSRSGIGLVDLYV